MTAEEFWDKIVISEEEKEASKYFLEYRGIAEHENVRVFLQSLKETTVSYSEIATAFRYDKRIRRVIFKYIGFLEEYLRAYISNTYGENIGKFQHTRKLNAAFNKFGNLFLALSDLTFGQLINQIKLLSEEEKYRIFSYLGKVNLFNNSNLDALVVLRNEVYHNRFLLDNKRLSVCKLGDNNNSLWINLVNLSNHLPDKLQLNFSRDINNSKFCDKMQEKYQTKWDLPDNLIISI